ncbi:MAG: hypothetical protein JWN73_237 [Betaproteobacteria bacterium]|nr:hypothetical protein [Betaproteobacteria bacterium]
MSATHISGPPRAVAWLYAVLCAAPYAAVAAAFSPLADCGFICLVGPILMVAALALGTALLAAGLLLRRAQGRNGQSLRLVSWAAMSQGLLVLGCGGLLLFLALGG